MISGINLEEVKSSDYGSRFLILTTLMCQYYEKLKESQDEDDFQHKFRRFNDLQQQLQQIEEMTFKYTSEQQNKETECQLILDDLHKQYSEFIISLEKNNNEYENLMMKMWRDTIQTKKVKDEKYKKEQKDKGGNNKNLMFLTSQILKKGRILNSKIDQEVQQIFNQLKQLEELLGQQEKEFKIDFSKISAKFFEVKNDGRELEKTKEVEEISQKYTLMLTGVRNTLDECLKKEETRIEARALSLLEVINDYVSKMLSH